MAPLVLFVPFEDNPLVKLYVLIFGYLLVPVIWVIVAACWAWEWLGYLSRGVFVLAIKMLRVRLKGHVDVGGYSCDRAHYYSFGRWKSCSPGSLPYKKWEMEDSIDSLRSRFLDSPILFFSNALLYILPLSLAGFWWRKPLLGMARYALGHPVLHP